MLEETVDRDIMLEFERDSFRAKRAIVVAIIFSVLLLGIPLAAFLLQDHVYKEEHNERLDPHELFVDSFTVATYSTPVEIEVERTNPVDICLVETEYYEEAETVADAFKLAIEKVQDSTTFSFKGELDTGKYTILMTSSPLNDTVSVKLSLYVIKPCLLWIVIVIAVLVLLLFLRIGLKFRRLGIIKRERNDYLARAAAKPVMPFSYPA